MIATADIGRVKDGALADYQVDLQEDLLGDVGDMAFVRSYPRWSASVWDLVARCIAAALSGGREELPPRPVLPDVPAHTASGNRRYVRLREIPEPARTFFQRNIANSGRPLVEEDPDPLDCAWAHDWSDFLDGQR
ncbi:hypothetical protein [Paraburkholderia tagetis]|uniref:hypothetical protein n=1 Tax=Paraburkholderia tagetis TaxID=2913261 RepID=UPI0030841884